MVLFFFPSVLVYKFIMPSNPKKGKTSAIKCTENLKEFYENEDEFKFSEGKL